YYSTTFMWDGRARGILAQVQLPLNASNEIDIDWATALARVGQTSAARLYLSRTGRREIEKENVVEALAAYVHSLVTTPSAFDRWFFEKATSAIPLNAERGFVLFAGKARCTSCHLINSQFALFTDNSFHIIGAGSGAGRIDAGRAHVTSNERDLHA